MSNSRYMRFLTAPFAIAMAVVLAACGTASSSVSEMPSVETDSPTAGSLAPTSTVPASDTTEPASMQETTEISMTFGDTVITATLDGSEASRAFMARLPLTLTMSRYADREYYAAIEELPEAGERIDDFENGDVTYYTAGKSLALFFGNAESSSQSDLIRMGKITSDLSLFDEIGDSVEVTISLLESEADMAEYDFSNFTNVEMTGIDLSALNSDELALLYQQARYCQAMTDADIETLSEIAAPEMTFTHMSGRQQTREEYFADIENGALRYFTIGMENPVVTVDGDMGSVTFTSVLNADAYGARGTYRMSGTHWYRMQDGAWIASNAPEETEME
ncbi:cyclophilin-like fold protein [Dysosmobacter welbionis]|uniref:cyclophilin-like fold protein n=1 Tax=Dysosmobacter welbionis TaxID=2093857 RepID=UPI0032C1980F